MIDYNITSALFKMAASQPDALAIALPAAPGKPLPKDGAVSYHKISFKELANQTNCLSRGLLAAGFESGDRVVLMVPPSIEFFTLSFAFLQSGIVPVLIDPGIGIKNLKKCIDETQPTGFIGITKAHIARVLLGWGRSTIKKKITIGPRLFWGGKLLEEIKKAGSTDLPRKCFAAQPEDLCGILFTSGSTGVPKGVMSTYGNMYHQVQMIRDTYDMKVGQVDLPTFLPFALFNPVVGMSSIIPDMDPTRPANVDPERLIRTLQQFNVTSMFGSPALIDRVGRYGEANDIKLPSLKRVLSAGAPVPAKTLRRFASMLNDDTPIFTPYGATEALPVASIGSHEILTPTIQQLTDKGGGVCIGSPVKGLQAEIIQITDDPIESWSNDLKLEEGEIGEITIKGKNVTQAYFNREEATQLAKIKDHDRYWHRMGDLGYKDKEGRLWFCGRKAHRVKLAGKELYSVQCESVFNTHPQVYRTALVGVAGKAVLCVEIDKEADSVNEEHLRKELLAWAAANELTKDIQKVIYHPSFPVDIRHNAKIFREKLAVWAANQ
ncbi:fatty acid CoA ligase family protein [Lewinella cohaerens]|uniref:fatty acid CoA ligase family protein n=1 Tax=Lewinella cohaerens TaxID=70995 RepID=UPI0003698FD8|nr:fatty acid CoA ligase family protein [Lewinella cohaerens]